MLESPSALLTMLVLTHVVADFSLPFKRKTPSTSFITGAAEVVGLAAIHGLAVFLVLLLARPDSVTAARAAVMVTLSWLLISQTVPRFPSSQIGKLLIEHIAHSLVLMAVWLTSEGYWENALSYIGEQFNTRNLVLLLAYLLILKPASTVIGAALNLRLNKQANQDSLKNAGALIGYLERTLILTFVLMQQWEAVGFLLTAKSILRLPEIQKQTRQISEYVLLGTLMSFTLSISIGLLTHFAIANS